MDMKIRQQHQTGRKRGKAKTRLIRTQGNGYGLKRMKHEGPQAHRAEQSWHNLGKDWTQEIQAREQA